MISLKYQLERIHHQKVVYSITPASTRKSVYSNIEIYINKTHNYSYKTNTNILNNISQNSKKIQPFQN